MESGKVSDIVDSRSVFCDGCKYFDTVIAKKYKKFPHCKLRNLAFLPNHLPKECEYKNIDTKGKKICLNCKHFVYSELRCNHDYYRVPSCMDDACKEFESNDGQ